MPTVTIQLTGSPVTQAQKEALVSRSTDMIRDVLHQDPKITGVLIEEVDTESWGWRRNSVTHRFRSLGEYHRCLVTRWQGIREGRAARFETLKGLPHGCAEEARKAV